MSGCEVWFYHLERTSLDQALPELLEKTLARGWRAVVRTIAPERIQHLDSWLWSYRDESFLPHAPADEPGAPRQPILLTTGFDNPNGAQALFLVDGAEPGALEDYQRCVIVFDGADEAAVGQARKQWGLVKGNGHPVSYWRQQGTRWEKQA